MAVKEWEWLKEHPMLNIAKPKESRGRDRFLTQEEINRLPEACKESSTPHLHAIVALAIFTGMRYGEIVKLHWKDINFELGFITLQQTKNELSPSPMKLFVFCKAVLAMVAGRMSKSLKVAKGHPLLYHCRLENLLLRLLKQPRLKAFAFMILDIPQLHTWQ